MKKKNIILVCVALIITISGCSTTSYNTNSGHDNSTKIAESTPKIKFEKLGIAKFADAEKYELEPYFGLANQCVKAYYNAKARTNSKNVIRFPSFPYPLTDSVKKYLQYKYQYETISVNQFDNYEIITNENYTVTEWKIIGDSLVCSVEASLNYQNSKTYDLSGITETVQVIVNNPRNPILSDWFVPATGTFDSAVRGYKSDLYDKEIWLKNQDVDAIFKKCQTKLNAIQPY